MESNGRRRDVGGSLPVESVQSLAANKSNHIPHRFIRPEIELDQLSEVDQQHPIPAVDLSRLLEDPPSPQGRDEMNKQHWACHKWGFFQLINHGVCDELIERMKNEVEEFFKLTLEEKKAYSQLPNNIEGYGQAFVVSEEQKLDWGDMLFLLPRPVLLKNMRFWPLIPYNFRETLDKYSSELQRVAISLLGLMAKNLGFDPKKLTDMFDDGTQGLRMNYYLPCLEANKVLGQSPQYDATGLTLLLQVNQVQGLQIRNNGKWIPVKPLSGALIVNIGDILEILSNGKYKSIEHRAVINTAFYSPAKLAPLDATIGPLIDLAKGGDAYYRSVSHEEYVKHIVSSKLDGKNPLDFMKL
ncbi:S-norcoclaurine synthase 1-like [Tasmannia lanceolata]|uniref:S-norcoclaurine synthase 1-like n=1 Tax=Tasmannia lanceolata TaxID=3420 RepID=UPI004064149B